MPPTSSKPYRSGTITRTANNTWQAYIRIAGKQHRTRHATAEAARAQIDQLLQTQELQLPLLTPSQLMDAARALQHLPPGATLTEAAKHYTNHTNNQPNDPQTPEAAGQAYLQAKAQKLLRGSTLKDYTIRISHFLEHTQNLPPYIHQLTEQHLTSYLNTHKSQNRDNYHKALSVWFNWCLKRGWIKTSPLHTLERQRLEKKPIQSYTVEQTTRLLHAAQKHDPRLIPELALALFAGVRPHELTKLQWENIKPAESAESRQSVGGEGGRQKNTPEVLLRGVFSHQQENLVKSAEALTTCPP
jgi:integrase